MTTKLTIITVLSLALNLMVLSVPAHALLIDIGSADIYEKSSHSYVATDLRLLYSATSPFGPVIWLDYTNDAGGSGSQGSQGAWAKGLSGSGDQVVVNYKVNPGIIVNWAAGWRLPSTVDGAYTYGSNGSTTAGYNITSSEMGYLYYTELGNKGYIATDGTYPQPDWGLKNIDPFLYVLPARYWSETVNTAGSTDYAWMFDMSDGYQDIDYIGTSYYGMALRPGQIQYSSVPEPSTLLLVVGGLAGLAGLRLRRRYC